MRAFLIMGLAVAITSCCEASPVITLVKHLPLHPQKGVPVSFSVTATSPRLLKVTLEITEYELFAGPDGSRATRERPGGISGIVKTWEGSELQNNGTVEYTWTRGFADASFVVYTFTVFDDTGSAKRTIQMQAGVSPFGTKEILLYSASDQNPANTFKVCFLGRTEDYYRKIPALLKDLEKTLYQSYLVNNMIIGHTQQWSFYYTTMTTTRQVIKDHVPRQLASSSLDFFGFVHLDRKRDASSGNRFRFEPYSLGTIMHETGHAVFDLSDEYSNSSSAWEACNLFKDRTACETVAGGAGCSVVAGRFYSPEGNGENCVMNRDRDKIPQSYQFHCQSCIEKKYKELAMQPTMPLLSGQAMNFSTLVTQKVWMLELRRTNGDWTVKLLGAVQGVPSLNLSSGSEISMALVDRSGKLLHFINIQDPSRTIIEKTRKGSSRIYYQNNASRIIFVPYSAAFASLDLIDSKKMRLATKHFDLSNQVSNYLKTKNHD